MTSLADKAILSKDGVAGLKKYFELSATEAIQVDCDVKATNIILQGLAPEVYALVSTHKVAKELWERIQMLMQGTSLTKQERECKLYDEFDKFAYKKGESLRDLYLRFSLLLNDMNIYNMKLEQFQVNTKFLNTLPPEWSKFVTDVKLVRDLHTTNVDQLHAYLGQYQYHVNEYASQAQSSTPLSITYPSNDFQSIVNHNVYNPSSSIPQVEYAPAVHQQSNFSQPDTGLVVPVFQKGDDPINAINHMMSFLTAVVTSRETEGHCLLHCKGEGHMSKQCTKPKRKRDEAWLKDKVFLVQVQANGQVLHKEEIALMVNLSHYGYDNLAKSETKITSDSNIIPYSQYVNESQYATVQNLSFPAQQDDLILFVIEQLKTQVFNCTKINQDNKNVNEILTVELERYKDQAQQLVLKLYDGSVIQKTNAIVIRDSEETLMLKDESRLKMLQKQKDPMMSEKKVNIKPVDYVVLNQLSQDFETRFVPQTELLVEQAFWSLNSRNSEELNFSTSTTIVEVPKDLPKVSMVNSSLKKHKFYLASFDMVVKERTTTTAITEGEWGFEHTKACFRVEIVPFVKALKELFNSFDQFLIDDLTEVPNVFNQMEQAVEQHYVEKNKFQDKMKDVLKENERLLEQAMSTDIVNIVVNVNVNYASQSQEKDTVIMKLKVRIKSLSGNVQEEKIKRELVEIETINIELDHRVTKLVSENEHLKQTYKQLYDSIKSSRVRSKEQCDDLIKQVNITSAENSDLNASLQEKVLVITALKDTQSKLKGKVVVNEVVPLHSIDPELLKIDVA
nr:hypothetical protein [Tanacetum cinerariifolium]